MNKSQSELIAALAAEIAEVVYMDVAKWHLYLGDAKLDTTLAEGLYPLLIAGRWGEDEVSAALRAIPISLGGGRCQVTLADLVPTRAQSDLQEVLGQLHRQL